jgi:glutamate carboxypeptidase
VTPKSLLDWAHRNAGAMESLLRELVEIESPSSDAAAVERLARRIAAEMNPLGLEATLVPVAGAGPLLRAVSRADGPPVMLLGHLDTVWPVGRLRTHPLRVEGDALHGPGAFDMKGGLVVALFAVKALLAAGARPPVCLFFTPLEEVAGEAYRELMESEMRRSAAVLDFEPAWPGGAVKTGRKGSGSMVLRARGKAAHAGGDFDKGVNAIVELARKVLQASALTDLSRGVTVNVGVVRGGVGSNVIPDLAEAEIDFRVRTLEDGERIERALKGLRPDDARVSLEFDGGMHYPPLERTPAVAGLYEQARAVAAEMGMELDEISVGGASEASFAAAMGRPTLDGLGPDGDGAHADHEHVLLSSIAPRVALAAGLIARLTGPGA